MIPCTQNFIPNTQSFQFNCIKHSNTIFTDEQKEQLTSLFEHNPLFYDMACDDCKKTRSFGCTSWSSLPNSRDMRLESIKIYYFLTFYIGYLLFYFSSGFVFWCVFFWFPPTPDLHKLIYDVCLHSVCRSWQVSWQNIMSLQQHPNGFSQAEPAVEETEVRLTWSPKASPFTAMQRWTFHTFFFLTPYYKEQLKGVPYSSSILGSFQQDPRVLPTGWWALFRQWLGQRATVACCFYE